ncbi:MAG: HAD family hydrolase [Pseudonocardiaceae bacterium]
MEDCAIALLDWDNTLRPGFTMPEWTDFLSLRGQFRRFMHLEIERKFKEYLNGKITYGQLSNAVVDLYGAGLEGQMVDEVMESAREFVYTDKEKVFPFVDPLIAFFREAGVSTYIVSGCPSSALVAYGEILRWDRSYGIDVDTEDGRYTGNIPVNMASLAGKRDVVKTLAASHDVWVAAGDSDSDHALFDRSYVAIVVDNADLHPSSPVVHHWKPDRPADELVHMIADSLADRGKR